MKVILSFLLLTLSGCMHITTHLQQDNPAITPILEGRDCVALLLGLGWGTNTVDRAMLQGGPPGRYFDSRIKYATRITRLHSLAVNDSYFLLAGYRCLVVTGEP